MVINLSEQYSLISDWIAEIRDQSIQNDRMRFRRNLERIGGIIAYELSKQLDYSSKEVQTPLGIAHVPVLKEQPVVASILRAGIPGHEPGVAAEEAQRAVVGEAGAGDRGRHRERAALRAQPGRAAPGH